MELFLLYLWMKLDTFRGVLLVLGMVGTILLPFALMWAVDEKPLRDKRLRSWKWGAGVTMLLFSLFVVVPSSNQMAGLVVGGVALNAAESPEAQKMLTLLRKRANAYLDEQLKDN
jgi:hypothetical protein